ncbi:MAG: DsbA family oxidoreductase [Alphaproteobacteria bacterium]|nr:DsbA family oxidoreductase [Alphaproteobacteria bacterium]
MTEEQTTDVRVDIISDVVCPWCIIGYKQLALALDQTELSAAIRWHPFELNPQMAEEGEGLREHLAAKYGTTPEDSKKARERLTALGESLGFPFRYADDMRMVNTFRAHQILTWAGTQGRQHDLKLALFSAFFTHGQNVNDPDVLADQAEALELDRNEAMQVIADGRYAEQVREEESFWTSRGIQGVPAMVFNGRHLVTGAQGVDNYVSVLRQLTQGRAA